MVNEDGAPAPPATGAPAEAGAGAAAFKLVGFQNFKRNNPMSDRFDVHKFHHVEFWCGDATNTSKRFGYGLGMTLVAKSDQGTGNQHYASYVMSSNDLTFVFTAPYGVQTNKEASAPPAPWFDQDQAHHFLRRHGLAVRALGISVEDAEQAFVESMAHGARAVQPPTRLLAPGSTKALVIAEVELYGDVVLRYVSGDCPGPFFPGYERVTGGPTVTYGLQRLDHAVGNVPELVPAANHIMGFTGFHEFAEFAAEDVGTVDSGLNSVVLASNNEMVLLPVNEPTFGTRRKSQIQTYLDQNEGPGLQHMALKTDDIFATLREMRVRSELGGFEFMPRPSQAYYANLPAKIGPVLTHQQYQEVEELGILVDKDDQGVLLQIFTKPLGDRPTVFVEIIQRLCNLEGPAAGVAAAVGEVADEEAEPTPIEAAGRAADIGGFGKGNFSELFKSIEVYETDLGIN